MSEQKNGYGFVRVMEICAIVFAVVTGASSTGLLIFKGGALVQQVNAHETRLVKIESNGSPPVSEHLKLDDERASRTRADLDRMQSALTSLDDLRIQVARMSVKLDNIEQAVNKR